MNRSQLEHAIRASCDVLSVDEVTILGSQAILGSWHDFELPARASLSQEVDIADFTHKLDINAQEHSADILEGALGEDSHFHRTHGFYVDGVDSTTSSLGPGWEKRLVKLQNANTHFRIGWCLAPEDICAAKMAAHRDKDIEFVQAILRHGLLESEILVKRVEAIPEDRFTNGRKDKEYTLQLMGSL